MNTLSLTDAVRLNAALDEILHGHAVGYSEGMTVDAVVARTLTNLAKVSAWVGPAGAIARNVDEHVLAHLNDGKPSGEALHRHDSTPGMVHVLDARGKVVASAPGPCLWTLATTERGHAAGFDTACGHWAPDLTADLMCPFCNGDLVQSLGEAKHE